MTSRGIYKQCGFTDMETFRAGCDCTDPEHDHLICISVEEDFPFVSVVIDSDLVHCNYNIENNGKWYEIIWARIKSAASVLFTGRLKVSQSFYFSNEEHALDYTKAINDAIGKMKLHKDEK